MFEEGKKYYEIEIRPLKDEFTPEEQAIIRSVLRDRDWWIEIAFPKSQDENEFLRVGGTVDFSKWPSADETNLLRKLIDAVQMKIRAAPLGRNCPSDCDWCSISGDCNIGCPPVFTEEDWIYPALTLDDIEKSVISVSGFIQFWQIGFYAEIQECAEGYFDVNDVEVVSDGVLPRSGTAWCSEKVLSDFCARVQDAVNRRLRWAAK